eukprot:496829-Prorocentrum_minimum.AAC.2
MQPFGGRIPVGGGCVMLCVRLMGWHTAKQMLRAGPIDPSDGRICLARHQWGDTKVRGGGAHLEDPSFPPLPSERGGGGGGLTLGALIGPSGSGGRGEGGGKPGKPRVREHTRLELHQEHSGNIQYELWRTPVALHPNCKKKYQTKRLAKADAEYDLSAWVPKARVDVTKRRPPGVKLEICVPPTMSAPRHIMNNYTRVAFGIGLR